MTILRMVNRGIRLTRAKPCASLIALLLAGCSTLWYQESYMAGWTVATVETQDAMRICSAIRGDSPLLPARACAVRNSTAKRCTQIVYPGDEEAKAHEKEHCLGRGHDDRT